MSSVYLGNPINEETTLPNLREQWKWYILCIKPGYVLVVLI